MGYNAWLRGAAALLAVLGPAACGEGPAGSPEARAARPSTPSTAPAPPLPRSDFERGWTELPPPPEVRTNAATAWTGRELIMWSGFLYTGYGHDPLRDDGFSFDADARQWEEIAPAPLEPRALPATAWTGREMLVWGGWDDAETFFGDGAAYDPETDSWRTLPSAPLSPRAPLHVWTGTELIVWGTAVRVDERPRDGAAYDPATNTWRKIAGAPIELTDAAAVWTGAQMIVFGAALHGGNQAETPHATGALYDVASDAWRTLPPTNLSPQASTAAWNGREVIAWDYEHGAAAYSPERHEWRALSSPPLEFYECGPDSTAVSGYFFGNYCGAMVVFDRREDRWTDVTRDDLLAWGFTLVSAPPAVLLIGRDVDTTKETMLAYRPG